MTAMRKWDSGPWNGARTTSEPFDDGGSTLYIATNGYFPDTASGSGFYSRPGFVQPNDQTVTAGQKAVGIASVVVNGTPYNFVVVNGTLLRWPTDLSSAPVDVTPTNVTIGRDKFAYMTVLGESLVFTDGCNTPWVGTNLAGTPITATLIEYSSPVVNLSRGTTDTRVANAALFYSLGATTFTSPFFLPENLAGTALPAGTIPADQWGVYRVSVNSSAVVTVTAGAANYTTGYASEAAAIAALPATPANQWNVGYFTVQTATGLTFVATTDALQGGVSGNPANATNYYAGAAEPWVAWGAPVVYTGAVFFILRTVSNTTARTTIVWSEPNQPLVGYFQDDYDNQWTLTQTGADPIFALAATNDALYYSRAYSWGAISGAPGVNFASTATHDVVSANIGCTSPATVQTFLNYVYFCDQIGRPYRFAVGGAPEPIWQQARELFEDNATRITQAVAQGNAWAAIEPNLNLYVANTVPTVDAETVGRLPLIFDAITGRYCGQWGIGGTTDPIDIGGQVRNASGQVVLAVATVNASDNTQVRLWRLALQSEAVWGDDGGTVAINARTPWCGFSADDAYAATRVTADVEFGNATPLSPPALTLTVYTTQGETNVGSYTPVSISSAGRIARYIWEMPEHVYGRGIQAQISGAVDGQCKMYRISVTARQSKAGIEDR